MFCPQCGSSNDDEHAFCKKCGASLRRGETPEPTPPPVTQTAPPTEPSWTPASPVGTTSTPAPAAQAPPPDAYVQPAAAPVSPRPVPAGQATEYAGFGWRFLAVFLDGILVSVISTMIGVMIGVVVGAGAAAAGADEDTVGALVMLFYYPIAIGLGWLYEAFMVSSSYQGTLGKMAVGIVVTDEQGRRISFLRATGRHFGKILSSLVLMAGYLMQPFTAKRQALHDMMAGCLVLRKVPR